MSYKMMEYYSNIREDMLKYIPQDVKKTLEIGCGCGGFSALVKRRYGAESWGIEIEEKAAKEAAKKLDKVINSDVSESLRSVPDNYFDCIILFDIVEHLVDPYSMLDALKVKLSKTGVIVTSIPNVRYWSNFKEFVLKGNWDYKDQGIMDKTHLRFFTRKSNIKMFKNLNFQVLQFEGIHPTSSITYKLTNLFLLNFLSDVKYKHYVAVVRPESRIRNKYD
ncbi:MAG: class I SAM-dependent methyltransferase [Planctomycetaceae bacterium]|nr:class I SAM-dependent methyltransferase [Planctomycetaceae bacterium]